MAVDTGSLVTNGWRQAIEQHLQHAWQHKGITARLLWPVSLLYRALLAWRRWAYQRGWFPTHRLPVPVVVVGNVVVGGTGKTPTVIALVQQLQAWGWQPGVISRGHGRHGAQCLSVHPDSDSALVGDEPLLLARATQVPLVVGRDRVAAGRALLQTHPEVNVIVSDDGMQHWALARDVTLVLFDRRGTGNGWLLPAGMLREPWPTAGWENGPVLAVQTAPLRRLAAHAVNARGQRMSLQPSTQQAAVKPVAAMAGIAQPQAFFAMLRAQGMDLATTLPLPDHANASTLLAALSSLPADTTWLCTEKDAVKLFPMLDAEAANRVWAVPLEQTLPADLLNTLRLELEGLSSRHGRETT